MGACETAITKQVRFFLDVLKIPHFKHFGGPLSPNGIPDIIGTLPGGQALYVEVKRPGGKVRPEQQTFLDRHSKAGAVCMVVNESKGLIIGLVQAGFEPAKRIAAQMHWGPNERN